MLVVFLQAGDIVLERIDAGRGQDSGLAHAPSVHAAEAACLLDGRPVRHDHRTDRGAEPLGKTEGDGFERSGIVGSRHSGRHDGVEEPGPVQVHGNVVGKRHLADPIDRGKRIDGPAAAVVRVLQADQFGLDAVRVLRPDGRFDLLRIEQAPLPRDPVQLHAGQCGRRALFIADDVGAALDDHFVARPGLEPKRQLVGHDPGRHEQGCFLAEQGRRHVLQPVDGGVFPIDIVPDGSGGHGLAHGLAWFRDGVASEVDHGNTVMGDER